ncbi:proline-rich protein 36-like [Neofelis nebulosa]|uniref:proline-rich protein 36-like n=1 Tax=Neofelis nebulosa TaxID=61452 RepID=UPI00272D5233|nr:proline-rich protein 36-like [Neofelis nebulosa]
MGREARVCELGLHVDRAGWRHTGSRQHGLHVAAREQRGGQHRQEMPPWDRTRSLPAPGGSVGGASDFSSETAAQVRISRPVSSSPASSPVPTARSPEPVSDSVSPSLSAPPLLVLCLCLSRINTPTQRLTHTHTYIYIYICIYIYVYKSHLLPSFLRFWTLKTRVEASLPRGFASPQPTPPSRPPRHRPLQAPAARPAESGHRLWPERGEEGRRGRHWPAAPRCRGREHRVRPPWHRRGRVGPQDAKAPRLPGREQSSLARPRLPHTPRSTTPPESEPRSLPWTIPGTRSFQLADGPSARAVLPVLTRTVPQIWKDSQAPPGMRPGAVPAQRPRLVGAD